MAWAPAKDAAVPNLLPRARLEIANQLTLATTYGLVLRTLISGRAAVDAGCDEPVHGGEPAAGSGVPGGGVLEFLGVAVDEG